MLCTVFLTEGGIVRKSDAARLPNRSKSSSVTGDQELMNGAEKCRSSACQYAKVAVHGTATSFEYSRLKTLSFQVATHQAKASEGASQQHRSRAAIRHTCWGAKFPD